jgi:hypothetical protein
MNNDKRPINPPKIEIKSKSPADQTKRPAPQQPQKPSK